MPLITIREYEQATDSPNAILGIEGVGEYPITIQDPFSEKEEKLLEWYFEEHLRFPFIRQVDAQDAAESIADYGHALFDQVFQDRGAYANYKQAARDGIDKLCFEIAGSPEFHRLHWEALKDHALPKAFSLEAPMLRKNLIPQPVLANARPSPTINLLIVTARPGGARDVGYRTISRPLVEGLRQAQTRVQIEILRPGTYKALVNHLEQGRDQHGAGFYHIIHFDTHGALLTYQELEQAFEASRFLYQARYGRGEIQPYEGLRAYLALEGDKEGQPDLVEASELADLLLSHQIPIVILNACQSGKQISVTETSLGSRLMRAGVQMVLAMSYSITVTAAKLMMTTLYDQLFAGQEVATAIRRARLELWNNKGRRAYFNQTIDLEDWLLPVVYQNRAQRLVVRDFESDTERQAYYGRRAASFPRPKTNYEFVGRDLDILEIERRLLRDADRNAESPHNILLVRGMGGAGKTTLLRHLGWWWQTTSLVDQVFYFGYDERAWTRQQLLDDIAQKLFSQAEYYGTFRPYSLEKQQAILAERLRARRHLLILDNLESITGANLAIQNTLPPEERDALCRLLSDLSGGKTMVLLGSRSGEEWLARKVGNLSYDLPGLDSEAASTLADLILQRHNATHYRDDPELEWLLKLLNGYPLPLEVVLANLSRQTPAEVVAALQAGDVSLDTPDSQKRTESILRCIDYSHSNLSPEAQGLLLCLAPFTLVISKTMLPWYTGKLRIQAALASLPYERWDEVLQEAVNLGLLSPHPIQPSYFCLHPTLPYFLRSRLNAPERTEVKQAIETAFREHYDNVGQTQIDFLEDEDVQKQQMGKSLGSLEHENLLTALNLALEAQVSFYKPYWALSSYLDTKHDERRNLELGQTVLARLENYPSEKLAGSLGFDLAVVLQDVATRYLTLKEYAAAEAGYQKALSLYRGLTDVEERLKAIRCGLMYHQLGIVAQKQSKWAEAEAYFQQALQSFGNANERRWQATVYHQLGVMAQEQGRWVQAEAYFLQSLQIKDEFGDHRAQALTYSNLGTIAMKKEQWDQAEEYCLQALTIFADLHDPFTQASVYVNLSTIAKAQGELAKAEGYCQGALDIAIRFKDLRTQAGAYLNLGTLAKEQLHWMQARDYYSRAIETANACQELHIVRMALLGLTQLVLASGDDSLFDAVVPKLGLTPEEIGERVVQALEESGQVHDHFLQELKLHVDHQNSCEAQRALRNLARLWRTGRDEELPATIASILGVTPSAAEELLRKASEDRNATTS
jgi:tetratricopeptide (TPR) repeat protein